jgi:nuclear pore complex protein Nup54
MTSLELIKNRGVSILPTEDLFRTNLENIHRELDKPSQYKSRIQELYDRLQHLKDMRSIRKYGNSHYEVVDSDSLQQIYKFLLEQQKGLAYLTEILQNSMREMQIMTRGYMESGREPQTSLEEKTLTR